jgi:hypothetical protein
MKIENENSLWLWFIRGTMLVVWPLMIWALNTLVLVDKNQGLIFQQLTSNTKRIEKFEDRLERDDRERMDWIRERSRRNSHGN